MLQRSVVRHRTNYHKVTRWKKSSPVECTAIFELRALFRRCRGRIRPTWLFPPLPAFGVGFFDPGGIQVGKRLMPAANRSNRSKLRGLNWSTSFRRGREAASGQRNFGRLLRPTPDFGKNSLGKHQVAISYQNLDDSRR